MHRTIVEWRLSMCQSFYMQFLRNFRVFCLFICSDVSSPWKARDYGSLTLLCMLSYSSLVPDHGSPCEELLSSLCLLSTSICWQETNMNEETCSSYRSSIVDAHCEQFINGLSIERKGECTVTLQEEPKCKIQCSERRHFPDKGMIKVRGSEPRSDPQVIGGSGEDSIVFQSCEGVYQVLKILKNFHTTMTMTLCPCHGRLELIWDKPSLQPPQVGRFSILDCGLVDLCQLPCNIELNPAIMLSSKTWIRQGIGSSDSLEIFHFILIRYWS